MNKILHLLIGAIGTGKSTYAEELKEKLNIDVLSADKIEGDVEVELNIMQHFLESLDSGNSFILDGLNLNKKSRQLYISLAKRSGYKIYGYDFGAGDENSKNRRLNDSRNVSSERWIELVERNKKDYEKPIIEEGFEGIFRT